MAYQIGCLKLSGLEACKTEDQANMSVTLSQLAHCSVVELSLFNEDFPRGMFEGSPESVEASLKGDRRVQKSSSG